MCEYMISFGFGIMRLKRVKIHGRKRRMSRKDKNRAFFSLLVSLRAIEEGLRTAVLYSMVPSMVEM